MPVRLSSTENLPGTGYSWVAAQQPVITSDHTARFDCGKIYQIISQMHHFSQGLARYA